MKFLKRMRRLLPGNRMAEARACNEEELRLAFKARCGHFKSLLSANKRVLAEMATLEEALRGERVFGMSFVRARCTVIMTGVFNMVRHLNAMGGDGYAGLYDRIKDIQHELSAILAPRSEIGSGPLVLSLSEVDYSMADEVGAKMAGLGEIRNKLGRRVPSGFVVTASGYRRFMEANNLKEEINRRMQMTDLTRLDEVFALSSSLRQLIGAAPVPDDLCEAILGHHQALDAQAPGVRLAVRSSAIGEDARGSSHAGQYRSELNVTRERLLDAYKDVVASKYGVTAMSYRINRGIPDDEVPMCVGCLAMVEATAGGVAYSRDPLSREPGVVISAVPGLPKSVVDGSAPSDLFKVSRPEGGSRARITERRIADKPTLLGSAPDGGVSKLSLPDEASRQPSLTDGQILEVAAAVQALEDFYGSPQDVEWAYAPDGGLTILQSRPLQDAQGGGAPGQLPEGARLLLEGGVGASPGAGAGKVFAVRGEADMLGFPAGAVLLVEYAHARWAPVLSRAEAVLSEHGGAAGHLASVAREYGVPAIFGLPGATSALRPGSTVTVDADARRVLDGRVDEVLTREQARPPFSDSPIFAILERAARHIVPLHLLDPASPAFSPVHCRTAHDITRYCHEKAVEEMFRMDGTMPRGHCGRQLRYRGAKLQYFVINIDKGFCGPVNGNTVDLDEICSEPMHALWDGMLAIPWAGPRGTSGKGFWTLVAESASNPELEVACAPTRSWRNYFMVDRDYCHLQASFGYHFCTIEAQAGQSAQENYVNFHFKGGAANLGRRVLRVQAIGDVLVENGFIVDIKEDALSARAEDLLGSEVLELLLILGYLLVHTRQMDIALGAQESRVAYADVLRKGIAQVMTRCARA